MEAVVHSKSRSMKKVGPNLYRAASGRYYLLVKRSGKQFRRSLKTKDATLARRRLREFQDKAARLAGSTEDRKITFDELAKRWLASRKAEIKASSYGRRVTAVKGLSPYFKGQLVRSIGQRQIEAWKIGRGPDISARTWNIEIETLNQMLAYAKDHLRILIDNPASSVKRKKLVKSGIAIPTKEQFRAILNELRDAHKATGEAADLVEFLGYSGCRQAETWDLRWRDINMDLGTVLITGGEFGTKNYEARTIPLFAPLRRLVDAIKKRKGQISGDELVFSIQSARLQLWRACERLGLPRFGHHAMRHFFCSNAIEAGCDFKVIAEWLGHKDGGVLVAKTYGHLCASRQRQWTSLTPRRCGVLRINWGSGLRKDCSPA
jgi:integrase